MFNQVASPRSGKILYPCLGILVLVLLALTALHFFYRKEQTYLKERLTAQNSSHLKLLSHDIQIRLGDVAEDIRILASSSATEAYLKDRSEENEKELTKLFLQFSRHKSDYSQIRFIDEKGWERVRVDLGGVVASKGELQDKSSRYYVKEGIEQNRGDIYVSPIDLNVELGGIEVPYVPVIRYVLPLDDGFRGRKGLIVINYQAGELLKIIRSMGMDNICDVEILNADGYWILNDDAGLEWGFMFPDGSEKRLSHLDPELWDSIEETEKGTEEIRNGLVTWMNFPVNSIVNDTYRKSPGEEARDWKLLVRCDQEALSGYYSRAKSLYLELAFICIGLGLFTAAYWIIRHKHQQKIDEINELNAQAFMNAQVAVIQTDLDGLIISFNRAAEQLLGWKAGEVVERENITLFHEPFELEEQANTWMGTFEETIEPGFEVYRFAVKNQDHYVREWLLSGKDKRKIPVILTISGVRDSSDETVGYMVVAIDISDRKKVETALLEAKEKAEEVAQIKSQFLANMSHEIRTPMNGVIGLSNLLLDSGLSPHQEQLTKTLVNSAEVLLTVINDILDFSKIDAGAMSIEEASFDLRDVVDNTLMLYASQADVKKLELINKMDPELNDPLLGDAHRITQILSNLIGNSIKFTEKGEVVLSVEATSIQAEHITILFEVTDTGIGMTDDIKKRIFTPFTQADASTTRRFGGTGLGLTITAELVALMNGSIEVTSEVGRGTCFRVEIPFKRDLEGKGEEEVSISLAMFEEKRALVVDDNLTNLMVLKGQLSAFGFTVKTVDNAHAGYLEYVNQRNYELIVLDYLMPELDGLQLAKRLYPYREGTDSHLIILSSSQTLISGEDKATLDIDRQLSKPISPKLLKQVLEEVFLGPSRSSSIAPQAADPVVEAETVAQVERSALRIILADDDKTNQQVIELQLKKLGMSVTIVDNGALLLKALEAGTFDLVLLDCNMPIMDGFEAAQAIRKREGDKGYYPCGHQLWIIAMTALAFKEDKEKCIACGMNDFLTKPARVIDIEDTLSRYPYQDMD